MRERNEQQFGLLLLLYDAFSCDVLEAASLAHGHVFRYLLFEQRGYLVD